MMLSLSTNHHYYFAVPIFSMHCYTFNIVEYGLPSVRETWVQSLGWEDLLEEGMATHSSIPAWRITMARGDCRAIVHGVVKSWAQRSD